MIHLPVDEAYAFDYLAILLVKQGLIEDSSSFKSINKSIEEVFHAISFDVTVVKLITILCSSEFKDMINANKELFLAVDESRKGNISSSKLDMYNQKRHKAKIKLQERFFNSQLTEIKN